MTPKSNVSSVAGWPFWRTAPGSRKHNALTPGWDRARRSNEILSPADLGKIENELKNAHPAATQSGLLAL